MSRPVAHYSRRGIDALQAGAITDCESIDLAPVCHLCGGSQVIERVQRGSAWEVVPSFEGRPHAEECPVCFVEPAPD